jgi:hypothetical protein
MRLVLLTSSWCSGWLRAMAGRLALSLPRNMAPHRSGLVSRPNGLLTKIARMIPRVPKVNIHGGVIVLDLNVFDLPKPVVPSVVDSVSVPVEVVNDQAVQAKKLWIALLCSRFDWSFDGLGWPYNADRPLVIAESRNWFGSRDFFVTCALCDLDGHAVLEHWTRLQVRWANGDRDIPHATIGRMDRRARMARGAVAVNAGGSVRSKNQPVSDQTGAAA